MEDERRWYLFTPTQQGMQRMPVYVDAPNYERAGLAELGKNGGP